MAVLQKRVFFCHGPLDSFRSEQRRILTTSLVGDDIDYSLDARPIVVYLSFAPNGVIISLHANNSSSCRSLACRLCPSTTRDVQQDYITASEFADTLMEFVNSDSSIQSLVQAI